MPGSEKTICATNPAYAGLAINSSVAVGVNTLNCRLPVQIERGRVMSKAPDRLYRGVETNNEAVEKWGKWFNKHMMAMTAEGLHSKSAIAWELAKRDTELENSISIPALKAMIEEIRKQAESSDPYTHFSLNKLLSVLEGRTTQPPTAIRAIAKALNVNLDDQ